MRILIIKTSSLGDIVQAFHVLPYLKGITSDVQIDWVVEQPFAELPMAHPDISQVLTIHTKKWRRCFWKRETRQEFKQFCYQLNANTYDLVFDLQGNMKSGMVTALAQAPQKVGFGYATVAEWPNLLFTNKQYNPPSGRNIREDYLFLVQQALDGIEVERENGVSFTISEQEQEKVGNILVSLPPNDLHVMICPGSNWANKQLSYSSLKAFLELLYQHFQCHFLLIWGTKEEAELASKLALAFPKDSLVLDKLALPTLQYLMSHLQLVIAVDSLPLHLAATTNTPTYSIFGASAAAKYQPLGSQHHAYQGSCPYKKTFEKRCPLLRNCPTGACIKEIEGYHLFEHFMFWWETHVQMPHPKEGASEHALFTSRTNFVD